MPSITFDLETVTPLFLAGANQEEAELRQSVISLLLIISFIFSGNDYENYIFSRL
ncbi:hypothetical protein [Gloeothece verrucosa]|uniref:Uncharacterized protein n=1 Tax=Gloeothece verrucosa (strain PCC 7822) TaxID=497965 RepID=E0UIC1_GLOV7|nr:hypothetical protein [Gloeothece verrucosa]ADN16889.1 conserved hypothetical protein [Gloeothece verrucosa PCC 7822]